MTTNDPGTATLAQYIEGEFRTGRSSRSAQVIDPATEKCIGEFPLADERDVEDAIRAAARAFPSWRKLSADDRGKILKRMAALLRSRRESIGRSITLELGKPLAESIREVETAAEMFEWAAEEGRRTYGRVIPGRSPDVLQLVQWEPVGVVGAFSGWNAPAVTPARKISGALASGCTIVLKPSEETPTAALSIALAASEAGLPAGVLNIVFGDPAAVAGQILDSGEVKMVTFTGGTEVGKQIAEKAARTLKRATLELGGHAPVVVFDDVNVDMLARRAAAAKFRSAGQVCTSPTRFYIHSAVYEQFRDAFVDAASQIRVGGGLDPSSQMGPLKNERRRAAIESLADDARKRGAIVRTGGKRIEGQGFFYAPTVITDYSDDCRVAAEEPFGPLALLRAFDSEEQALREANRLPFGLAAYIFTRDASRARRMTEAVECGSVCVNEWVVSLPETPFGGVKDSGFGREGGMEGLREFMHVKSIRHGDQV